MATPAQPVPYGPPTPQVPPGPQVPQGTNPPKSNMWSIVIGVALLLVLGFFVYLRISNKTVYEGAILISKTKPKVPTKVLRKGGKYILEMDGVVIDFVNKTPESINDIPINFSSLEDADEQVLEIGDSIIKFGKKNGSIVTESNIVDEISSSLLKVNDSEIEYMVKDKLLYLNDEVVDFENETPNLIDEEPVVFLGNNQIQLGQSILDFNKDTGKVSVSTENMVLTSAMYNGDVISYDVALDKFSINGEDPKIEEGEGASFYMITAKNRWKVFPTDNAYIITNGDVEIELNLVNMRFVNLNMVSTQPPETEREEVIKTSNPINGDVIMYSNTKGILINGERLEENNSNRNGNVVVMETQNNNWQIEYEPPIIKFNNGSEELLFNKLYNEFVTEDFSVDSEIYNKEKLTFKQDSIYINDKSLVEFKDDIVNISPESFELETENNKWYFELVPAENVIFVTNGSVDFFFDTEEKIINVL